MKSNDICYRIRESRNEITDLLSEMIAIPSPTGKESEMSGWLAKWLDHKGFNVDSFDIDPEKLMKAYPEAFYRFSYPYENRPNVVGVLPGKGNGRSLMLNFHLDVVDVDRSLWTRDPWKACIEDGLLYGRGACDMKGGGAAILYAVKSIIDSGIKLKGDLIVSGVVEEEGPGNGILALQERGIRADACVIPEPTDMKLCTALTGGAYLIVTVKGSGAHSTMMWEGVNALEKAEVVVAGIRKWRDLRKSTMTDPRYSGDPDVSASSPVVNILRADNGNIGRIPGKAQVWTRATVMPGEDPKMIANAMQEVILSVTDTDPWLAKEKPEFSWVILGGRSYPAEISETHESIRLFRDSIHALTGNVAEPVGFVSPADMQQLLNLEPRTPTFMFGPGSIARAHTEDEYVPVDQVVQTAAILADFIQRWCGVE